MRVLMFGWEFPPYLSGGLGIACHDMAQALAQNGVKVKFIQPQLKGIGEIPLDRNLELCSASGTNVRAVRHLDCFRQYTGEFWEKNLEIYSIDSILTPYLTPQSYDEYLENLTRGGFSGLSGDIVTETSQDVVNLNGGYGKNLMEEVYRYSCAAAAIAAKGDFDVIHVHDWMTYPAGIIAKMISGKPLVVHSHSLEHDRSGQKVNGALAHMEWEGMNAADVVVAVSHFTRNLIIQHYQIPEHKIKVVHNAVTRSEAHKQYHIPEILRQEKRVLFMGRITYQKGPDYFVEAARLVLNKIPNARFVMAGTGDMMLRLVRRVSELRMGSKFHFTGFMGRREVEHAFALSDLYVMPSVSEPFGITPLEAMASDVPVIISNQSGVAEVLTGALKVDFWDVTEMANKICAVLAYPTLSDTIIENCRADLKQIKWENAANLLVKIYDDVLNNREDVCPEPTGFNEL